MNKTRDLCQTCSRDVTSISSRLVCERCSKLEHLVCLRQSFGPLPTQLLGDTFFTLLCSKCSPTGREVIKRDRVNWLTALTVALYNLKKNSPHVSREGFFHWKVHIAAFIEKHWSSLFGPQMKKRKTWLGNISGTLSTMTGEVFKSGLTKLNEPGWWALVDERLPADLIFGARKPQSVKTSLLVSKSPLNSQAAPKVDTKRTRGVRNSVASAMALKEKRETIIEAKEIRKAPQHPLAERGKISAFSQQSNELVYSEAVTGYVGQPSPKLLKLETDVYEKRDASSRSDGLSKLFLESGESGLGDFQITSEVSELNLATSTQFCPTVDEMISSSKDSLPDVADLVSNLCNPLDEQHEEGSPLETTKNEGSLDPIICSISLPVAEHRALTRHEERELLKSLESENLDDAWTRRFVRKLKLREQLRAKNCPVFDFDEVVKSVASSRPYSGICRNSDQKSLEPFQPQILDRYQISNQRNNGHNSLKAVTFRNRLLGTDANDLTPMTSPMTGRILKPFIRRDYKMTPLKLKIFQELHERLRPDEELERYPIDFMYVHPSHVAAINNLACAFFWPGIDISECLQYPDFSCVAVYRKIVVGFAFMVPDVSHTEAYISFIFTHPEWRRVGIAKFMLYHLCQTCMGKDITLHVSANNPAVLLYQKFGFKIEEYITDFYDKYLPFDSQECKNALFLRLSR